ncbi:hypothetical protein LEA_05839, partial [human gut metagenome]
HTATIILLTANIPTVKSCTHSDVKKLVFDLLNEGKSYCVRVKLRQIIKIYKK